MSDVEAAASGKRVAFVADEHSKRRLIVLLPDGQELPGQLARQNGGSGGGQRGSNQAFVGELQTSGMPAFHHRRGEEAAASGCNPLAALQELPSMLCSPSYSGQAGSCPSARTAH